MVESQPTKDAKKKVLVGPTKSWSKVIPSNTNKRSLKRKEVPSSNSKYDVEHDATDNISFYHGSNALKWKYICQRRLALKR
jgi:hypothetical protein